MTAKNNNTDTLNVLSQIIDEGGLSVSLGKTEELWWALLVDKNGENFSATDVESLPKAVLSALNKWAAAAA